MSGKAISSNDPNWRWSNFVYEKLCEKISPLLDTVCDTPLDEESLKIKKTAELKILLERRCLSKSGKKSDLVHRLLHQPLVKHNMQDAALKIFTVELPKPDTFTDDEHKAKEIFEEWFNNLPDTNTIFNKYYC
ncbi:SAP domain-containing protein [Tetraselmis virus 1]|uniref:SAP domain-containing protein n=1 Tax=Tetraselmis virus 1 TaxID=2060617 RepID=A0A2P0VNZ4_9VIRU|nr:SAP domain-containing protein [Tetraselmis virus 1]AUF82624.1 SAP domain-containing protein [Tetraselmis virus 1]